MRTARSGAIGIVTSEIQNPFLPHLLDALTRAAGALGVHPLVWNDDSTDAREAVEGFASGMVDGVIFTAVRSDSTGVADLVRRGAPVVLCNRAPVDAAVDVVMTDHGECGRMAAQYLIDNGRRYLGAIFGGPSSFASPQREQGFRQALRDAGLPLSDQQVGRGPTRYETGYAEALSLLCNDRLPEAVFCSSDIIAFGAMDAIRSRGLRVPEDIWVIGIDGLPMSRWRAFDLTTFEQDVDGIATAGIERLLWRITGNEGQAESAFVPSRLAVRGSTDSAAWGSAQPSAD
jgi:LacI family transcriptional regulator